MTKSRTPTIFVVSDGRGDTCAQVLDAAVVQFAGRKHQVIRRRNVRTATRVEAIVRAATRFHAVVFYTLVGHETREAMTRLSKEMSVPTVDVLGPAFSALHDLFHAAPGSKPGLLYSSDRERFDRVEAIDYTLKYDDGQRAHELDEADVVVVGVSRSSKTSTCFYLAYRGIKAANVPIIPDIPLPDELEALDPERVIGLHVNTMRLATVRAARAHRLGSADLHDYLDRHALSREVHYAQRVMDEHGWRSFDASYMAIEEIAREVMALRGLSRGGSR